MLWTLTFMVFGHLKLLSVSSQTLTSTSDSIPDSSTEFQQSDRVTTDAGYVYSAGIGSHKIHSTAATWNEAWWICRQELGHLAIINSLAESQAIAQLFLESYPHFGSLNSSQALIGFHDRFREDQYVTIHDESLAEAGFDDWFPDQPDNALGGENCGAIVDNGQLNDVNCNEPYAFVCERPYFEEESGVTISSESSESLSTGESYEDFGSIVIFDSYNETEFNATSEDSSSIAATASSGSDTPQSSSLSTTGFDSSDTTVSYESETTESPDSDITLFGIDSTFSTFQEDYDGTETAITSGDETKVTTSTAEIATTSEVGVTTINDIEFTATSAVKTASTSEVGVTDTSDVDVTITSEVDITTTSQTAVTESEVEEGCSSSEFDCCPDNKTAASGYNFEGCDVIDTENCTASYYGCCPNGVTAALGLNIQGCDLACENSTFGCCNDGSTPAHGPNNEGCCLVTSYGCCPDDIQLAQGPDLYGCDCQYSMHGCCPDNTTAARGSDNEGCSCEDTPHGCCPNRVAVASGPNFEGCACYTYQFGCCPDGVSIARGPQEQGCGCENTEFKCCSDGITPAKGENYAGCTCDASKYGCCPDGVEEAQGEDFEGCLTVPLNPGAACALEKDRGSCLNFTVRWFYDTEYGGCSRFWYSGCKGNGNKFMTEKECKDVCVKPKGRDACFLPQIAGPCEKYHPTWYYDADRKECDQFIYKGCLGNANNFKTRDECEDLCVIPDDVDACEQSKEVGPCQGNFTRWYFNKESDSCEEFAYGGCKANKNNFPTQTSCQHQCLTPVRSRDSCFLPREEGSCTEKHARWYFDQTENRCMPFYYTGCDGNRNNFETRDSCDSDCPPKIDVCLLPALLGECYNYTQRWYYDSYESRCKQFYYGGCGGNENNFATEHDCAYRCQPLSSTTPPENQEFRVESCFLGIDPELCTVDSIKWFYDSKDGVCKQTQCAGTGDKYNTVDECENRCGDVQDLCELPPVVGPCKASFTKYYYDSSTDLCYEFTFGGCQGNKNNFEDKNSCEQRCRKSTADTSTTEPTTLPPVTELIVPKNPTCSLTVDFGPCNGDFTAYYYEPIEGVCQAFIYGGCEGNANRFQTVEQCERLCGSFQGQDVCNIQADPGPCFGSYPKFYYDPIIRGCREFSYGGCDGNANRFTSEEECESVCIHREEPSNPGNRSMISIPAICKEPVSIGSCSVGAYKRFYYDDDRLNCIAFVYTGCGGNRNRFKSYDSCMKTCYLPVENEVDVGPGPEPKDPCLTARDECNALRCPYGKEDYVDQQNCQHCRCADPCRSIRCPEGTRCAIAIFGAGDSQGQAVCRLILKPGDCPKVSNTTTCEQECSSDADCADDFKCCTNGCGSSCLQPAPEEPVTTPPPQYSVTLPPDAEPASIQQPVEPRVSAEEGSYVTLPCACSGNPRPSITWRKDATLIDNSLSRHIISNNGSLQIVGLYRTDAGTYTCTADNHLAAPVRIQYELDITAPHNRSSAILGVPNDRVTVSLNSPTTLRCNVVGWPRPIVYWWHEDKILPMSNNEYRVERDYSLRIHRVGFSNLGSYKCQAYNPFGTATWSVILRAPGPVLNINSENEKYAQYLIDPPRRPMPLSSAVSPQYPYISETTESVEFYDISTVVPDTDPSSEIVPGSQNTFSVPVKVNLSAVDGPFAEGSEFSIACNVDGFPPPRIEWFKDDYPILTNNRITISAANILTITNADKSDSGRYRCQADNELTSDADTLDVKVAGIFIHPSCQDFPFFAKCDLIVEGKYCHHKYYAKFCCRSCTEAGQLPARGQHINEIK